MNKVISREYVEKNYVHKDIIKKRYEELKHYEYIEIKELLKLLEDK